MRDSKTGRRYVHNICHPCRIEDNRKARERRLSRDPGYDVRQAAEWNRQNRDKYNERRRKKNRMKRLMTYGFQNAW
jgi:hypothetical protein